MPSSPPRSYIIHEDWNELFSTYGQISGSVPINVSKCSERWRQELLTKVTPATSPQVIQQELHGHARDCSSSIAQHAESANTRNLRHPWRMSLKVPDPRS